jgi:hypothetical protein
MRSLDLNQASRARLTIKIITEERSKINYIAHVSYSVIPDAQDKSQCKLTGAKKDRDFGVNPDY